MGDKESVMREFSFLKQRGIKRIHCLGVGGAGVSGLADILLQAGYTVTGSDRTLSTVTQQLQQAGLVIAESGSLAEVKAADCVVYSRAVSVDDPERQVAAERGIPVYSRGEFLAQMVGQSPSLVVAGSHGKSTTSGWAATALKAVMQQLNIYVGAVIENLNASVAFSATEAPWVLESDESDGSCFLLSPSCLILTNIDADHLEAYDGSMAVLQDRMVEWINAMDASGVVVACLDDPGVQAILPRLQRRVITYGLSEQADYRLLSAKQQGCDSVLHWSGSLPSEEISAKVRLPGTHNALNGLAAWVAAQAFTVVDSQQLTDSWSSYRGVQRRMTVHGMLAQQAEGALIIEDYGHHPSEIDVTLRAVKQAWPEKRVVMLFQPHRYTRTQNLFDEFVAALQSVPKLYLLPVYAASELPIAGVDSTALAAAIEAAGGQKPLVYNDLEEARQDLAQVLGPNDVLLLQGAGSVGSLGSVLCHGLGNQDATKEESTTKAS